MAGLDSHSWVCHKEAPAAVGMVLFILTGAQRFLASCS